MNWNRILSRTSVIVTICLSGNEWRNKPKYLFVIIACVLTAVLKIVFRLINRLIKEAPALKQVNTGLGVVLGVLRGAVLVFLVALALGLLSGLIANEWLIEAVRHSYVEKWVSGFLDSISGLITA